MSLNLHIERLILDGLPVPAGQGALVQAAVETELARLLADGNLESRTGGAFANLSTRPIQLPHDTNPADLGRQIARAVHRGLTPPAAKARRPGTAEHPGFQRQSNHPSPA
jgi:hypothetical protein